MATDWAAAVAKMRALVGVYLSALAKGPLSPHQAQSLATDLKTLDTDLAGLHSQLIGTAPVVAPTVDLSAPSSDTYKLAKQWIYAWTHQDAAPTSGLFAKADLATKAPMQIVMLVAQIVEQGPTYWPVKDYPPFTAAELKLAHDLLVEHPEFNVDGQYAEALTRAAAG